jgi:uncharacterized oxidoreductase
VHDIFRAAGCEAEEAERIAENLVEANLMGHDSHGVLRVARYIRSLNEGAVERNRRISLVFETEVIAVVDGQLGFGQSVGAQAIELGIAKSREHGVAVVGLRRSGHLGRIGHWAEVAARAGLISLHFVNALGPGRLVAPHGGFQRRLSASPIAVGIPVQGGDPVVFDVYTSAIAEGKIQVALNKQSEVPAGSIVDAHGQPTRDPRHFYADPPGAILPFGGHKGYGLAFVTELLAGALTGEGCSRAELTRLEQGMLTILLDPERFLLGDGLHEEIRRFVEFVRSSEPISAASPVLVPGELEQKTRAERLAQGIELDDATWTELAGVARSLDVPSAIIAAASLE